MSKTNLVNLIFLIISNFLIFFVLEDYIINLVFLLVSGLYYFICYMEDKKYTQKIFKFDECCRFIEFTLTNYKTSNSFTSCFEKSKKVLSKQTIKKIKDENTVLESLNIYYKFNIFSIFKNIIEIFSDVGGDIMNYSSSILKECRRLQNINYLNKKRDNLHMFSYFTMWLFAFSILIVAKISLSTTMFNFQDNLFYKILILLGFFLFLVSNYIFFKSLYKTNHIKEFKNEKNI